VTGVQTCALPICRIQAFTLAGDFLYEWGAFDTGMLHALSNPNGIESDQRGRLYVGIGNDLATFRTDDAPPAIKVNSPAPCEVLMEGPDTLGGVTGDDYGVDRIELTISVDGNNIVSEVYDVDEG